MNQPHNQQLVNLAGLDGLRGMLAVFVVAHHARWLCWIGQAKWQLLDHPWWSTAIANLTAVFRYGHEAVMVFFVLSGFFIHLRAAKQLASEHQIARLDKQQFARRRLHRLAAPYFFVLLLTFGLDSVGQHFFPNLYLGYTDNPLLNQNFAGGNYSARAVLPAMFMLPRSLGVTFGSNGPLWSLAYEVVFYALYPWWLIVRRRSLSVAYLGIPVVCLTMSGFRLGIWWLPTVLSHWPIWIGGAGLAEWLMILNHRYTQRAKAQQSTTKNVQIMVGRIGSRVSLCMLGGVLVVAGFLGCQTASGPIGISLCYLVLGIGFTLAFCTLPTRTEDWRVVWWWQFLGVRSYTIYILHFPILTLMAASFYGDGGPPAGGGFAFIATIATVLICVAGFELCERHFIHARIRVESSSSSR